MTKEFAKGSKERNMFNDLWELCKNFWIVEDNDRYWTDLIHAADEFEKKYDGDKLFCSWIASFISQKELEFHEMKGDTYGEDGKTSSTM